MCGLLQIKELAKLSESELPTVTRVLFTEEDLQAREFIRSKMRDAGMEVRCGYVCRFCCALGCYCV